MPEVTELLPPPNGDKEQHDWQGRIALAVIANGAATMILYALAFGLVPFFSGFSTVADVATVQRAITAQSQQMQQDKNELKALLLHAQLNQVFDAMCSARRGARNEEFIQWERQFVSLLLEYNRVSPQPYPMRDCG